MPLIQSSDQPRRPRIGLLSRTYTWPLAMRFSTRLRELGPDEASKIVNMLSKEDGIIPRDAFTQVGGALDGTPLRLGTFETQQATKFNLAHTLAKMWKFASPNWVDITRVSGPYTGTVNDPWDFVVCLNNYVATNFVDKIQYWDGVAANALDLPAAAAGKSLEFVRARFLEAFAGRLWLGYTSEKVGGVQTVLNTRLRWSVDSSFLNDADWTSLGSGFNDVNDTPDEIVGMRTGTKELIIYKKRSIVHAIETGDINAPFAFDYKYSGDEDKGVGLAASATLAAMPGFHIGLFTDNVYIWDGTSLTRIGDAVIRDVIARLSIANIRKAFATIITQLNLYLLFVPLSGQTFPLQCYAYDYRRDLWVGQWNFPASSAGLIQPTADTIWNAETIPWNSGTFSWDSTGEASGFPVLLYGDPNSFAVFMQDPTAAITSETPAPVFWTGDLDFGHPNRLTGINRVRVRLDSLGNAAAIGIAISSDGGNTFDTSNVVAVPAKNGEQNIYIDIAHLANRHLLVFTTQQKIKILEYEIFYSVRGQAN